MPDQYTPVPTKVCTKCGESKSLSAFAKKLDGLATSCKECNAAWQRQNRLNRPDHTRAQSRANHLQEKDKHPERVRERGRNATARYREHHQEALLAKRQEAYSEYYERYRERIIQRTRDYRKRSVAKVRETKRAYYERNRERIRAYHQAHHRANPEYTRNANRLRRARLRGIAINDFTEAQWREMLAYYDYRCGYCGEQRDDLVREHMRPLSRGGMNTAANICPSCCLCNGRKWTKNLAEFLMMPDA